MTTLPPPTPETIALDLAYHIRHIKRYQRLTARSSNVAVGVPFQLERALHHLDFARSSLLDGLDREVQ